MTTDYVNLIVHLAATAYPRHCWRLSRTASSFRAARSGRLIGAAIQEFYSQADHLTVSEAEATIESIVALATACARARLATDEAKHVKSRRKAALDYIEGHLGNARLGPDEIADAANVSRASLYRLLAAEGGIRAVLLTRRLDEALRLMLARQTRALVDRDCQVLRLRRPSQFSPAFRMRFGTPPRQYLALVRQQDLDWHEARLVADGFDKDALLWRHQELRGSK